MIAFMLVLLAVAFVGTTVAFFIFPEFVLPAYIACVVMYGLVALLLPIGERIFRKHDERMSEMTGEYYHTNERVSSIMGSMPKLKVLLIVFVVLAVIGGFTALCMWKPLIGSIVFAVFLAALLIIALLRKDGNPDSDTDSDSGSGSGS